MNFKTFILLMFLQFHFLSFGKDLVQKGIVNISDIFYSENKLLQLNGDWEFYPGLLITPKEVDNFSNRKQYISVPGLWTKNNMNKYGYATYRLLVKGNFANTPIVITSENVLSASKLWINKKLIFEKGKVATNQYYYKENISRSDNIIIPESNTIEIVLQVVNFSDFLGGGIKSPFTLQAYLNYQKSTLIFLIFTYAISGLLLTIASFNLITFILLKTKKQLLYLGLLTFGILFIFLSRSPAYVFPAVSSKYIHLSIAFCIFMGFFFMIEQLKPLFHKVFIELLKIAFILIMFFGTAIQTDYYKYFFKYFSEPLLAIIFMYFIYIVIKKIRFLSFNKSNYYILIAFLLGGASLIFDFFITINLIKIDTFTFHYTGVICVTSYSIYMILDLFKLFNEKEILSEKLYKAKEALTITNSKLEHIVEQRINNIESEINEQLRLNSEISKNKKLNSISVLAGGIAHNFNNLLTIIQGNIQLARLFTPKINTELPELIKNTENTIKKAADIADKLLQFSKGNTPIKKVESLNEIVSGIISLALAGTNVAYFIKNQKKILSNVNKKQISQALSNILINSAESMPKGGKVFITIKSIVLRENNYQHLIPGKYGIIEIYDEGGGIDKNIIDKIFDPFFSTKKDKKGLGLSTSYSIIKNHHGTITVENYGAGTLFSVYLKCEN